MFSPCCSHHAMSVTVREIRVRPRGSGDESAGGRGHGAPDLRPERDLGGQGLDGVLAASPVPVVERLAAALPVRERPARQALGFKVRSR